MLGRRFVALSAALAIASCASAPTPAPASVASSAPAVDSPTASPLLTSEQAERARSEFALGQELAGAGRHAEALSHFVAAAESYPAWALAHLEEARCRMILNQSEAEIRPALERALALAPDNPRVHFALGRFHENFGRDGAARAAYRRALALRGSYPEALYQLALLEELAGARSEARALFERAFKLDQANIGAALGAARLAEAAGDVAAAEAPLTRLIEREPDNMGHRQKLADLYRRTGQIKKAKKLQAWIDAQADERQRRMRPLKPSRR